jgi:hypothetical protein
LWLAWSALGHQQVYKQAQVWEQKTGVTVVFSMKLSL